MPNKVKQIAHQDVVVKLSSIFAPAQSYFVTNNIFARRLGVRLINLNESEKG